MRLLITGYPGWLTQRFLETRQRYPTSFSLIRCLVHPSAQLPKLDPQIEIIRGDLNDSDSLVQSCKGMDVILHAAGVLHVKKITDFYRINRDGTEALLKQAVKENVPHFIFISSNAAQGFCRGRGYELSEADVCLPASHYGLSKFQAENIVQKYFDSGQINTTTIRPAMFYGPPVPPRHQEIFKRIQGGTFPVFGDGNFMRSVTHVDNLVDSIHLVLGKPEIRGQTYSIADAYIPSLLEIIDSMGRALGTTVKIQRFPRFLADIADYLDRFLSKLGIYWMLPHLVGESHRHIACKIDKAKKELGYEARYRLDEGYHDAVKWCRDQGVLK